MNQLDYDFLTHLNTLVTTMSEEFELLLRENSHILVGGDTLWRPRIRRLKQLRDQLHATLTVRYRRDADGHTAPLPDSETP